MAEKTSIVGANDKGQFVVPLPRSGIERVDVIDIDLVIQTKGGDRLILPGAAIEAMTAAPPPVHFSDGVMGSADLLSAVDRVQTPTTSIPAMTSLTQFDQKRTEGKKNLTKDGADKAQAADQAQAQQVAPLPNTPGQTAVDKLVEKAEQMESDISKKAFDPAPIAPYEPPASGPDAPPNPPPSAKIPLYATLMEGNVVGVTPLGADFYGSGGPTGTALADKILVGDAGQYGTEVLTGTAASENFYADAFYKAGNWTTTGATLLNSAATYALLDKETGVAPTGTAFYYAKEIKLNVAGYILRMDSITVTGLPDGVSIEGATSLGGGSWSIPTAKVIPTAETLTLVYDVTKVKALGDVEVSFTMVGRGTESFTTTRTFVLRFQDVDDIADITNNSPKYIDGSGWTDIYVMPTASAPHSIVAGDGVNVIHAGNSNDTITAGSGADTIYAYAGNDTITAGDGNNVIWAGNGNDHVTTGANDDVIRAGSGDDVVDAGAGANDVQGGAGNDSLTGGSGNDTMDAGDGNDWIKAGTGANIIAGGSGTDTLSFADALITSVTLTLDQNGDRSGAMTRGDGGADTITGIENLIGSAGVDTFSFTGTGNVANTVWSGDGNDVVDGGDGDDVLYGEGGSDTLTGGTGDDTLDGGAGDDSLNGGDGADTLNGGDGNDSFIAALNDGADKIDGGAGTRNKVDYSAETAQITVNLNVDNPTGLGGSALGDTYTNIQWVVGGSHIYGDTLTGSAAVAEILEGRGGDDALYAKGDGDTLYGDVRNADDSSGSSSPRVTSVALTTWSNSANWQGNIGNGTNWANIGYTGDVLYGSNQSGTTTTMYGGSGYNNYVLYAETDVVKGGTTDATDFDRLTYSSQNLTGTAAGTAGKIAADAGGMTGCGVFINIDTNDHTWDNTGQMDVGGGGFWWNGTNFTSAMGGTTAFDATNANSGQYGWATGDTYTDIEQVIGSQNADVIIGNDENNYLDGQNGNDALFGQGGDDWIVAGNGVDYLDGGSSNAVGLALGGDVVDYRNFSSALTVDLSRTAGFVKVGGSSTVNGAAQLRNIEGYLGGSGIDIVTGTAAADRIDGRGGFDTIDAGDGDDIVYGGWGDGSGSGEDDLDGEAGSDWISYAGLSVIGANALGFEIYLADADLNFNNANDQISTGFTATLGYARFSKTAGGTEMDKLSNFENIEGSKFADLIAGNSSNNSINAGAGNDTIYGGGGNDTIDGGADNDTISYYKAGNTTGVTVDLSNNANNAGDAAGDILTNIENVHGTRGADTLVGDANANILDGDLGADAMSGGAGNDIYYVDNAGDTVTELASEGTDRVYTAVSFTLTDNVEILDALGSSGLTLTGSSTNNTIYGSTGDDIINGSSGTDYLYGRAGSDAFVLTSAHLASTYVYGGTGAAGETGTDTLKVADWNLSTNLNLGRIHSIESIDVRDGAGGDTTSALSYTNVNGILDGAASGGKLTLYLDSGDTFTTNGSTAGNGTATDPGGSHVSTYTYTSGANSHQVEVHWG